MNAPPSGAQIGSHADRPDHREDHGQHEKQHRNPAFFYQMAAREPRAVRPGKASLMRVKTADSIRLLRWQLAQNVGQQLPFAALIALPYMHEVSALRARGVLSVGVAQVTGRCNVAIQHFP
jgi:hypothetical protein